MCLVVRGANWRKFSSFYSQEAHEVAWRINNDNKFYQQHIFLTNLSANWNLTSSSPSTLWIKIFFDTRSKLCRNLSRNLRHKKLYSQFTMNESESMDLKQSLNGSDAYIPNSKSTDLIKPSKSGNLDNQQPSGECVSICL